MFGKNAEKNNVVTGKTLNLFAEGTAIKGDIKTTNDIRIDGVVTGMVYAEAKVVIGPNGKVTGDIMCQNADILGKVNGMISVKEMLILRTTAIIEGDIATQKLVVEAGAKFNGLCSMGNQDKALKSTSNTSVETTA